jgi:hypothetical protein
MRICRLQSIDDYDENARSARTVKSPRRRLRRLPSLADAPGKASLPASLETVSLYVADLTLAP